jgi:hypothetical protein
MKTVTSVVDQPFQEVIINGYIYYRFLDNNIPKWIMKDYVELKNPVHIKDSDHLEEAYQKFMNPPFKVTVIKDGADDDVYYVTLDIKDFHFCSDYYNSLNSAEEDAQLLEEKLNSLMEGK